ncbi:MAG: hypothetical protein AB1394_16340 [Bacteroidota bacterium]
MKRNRFGNVRLRIAYYFPSGSVLIQIVKDAQLLKMALQRKVLKKLMIMSLWGEFVLKMDGEEEKHLRGRKIEDGHN